MPPKLTKNNLTVEILSPTKVQSPAKQISLSPAKASPRKNLFGKAQHQQEVASSQPTRSLPLPREYQLLSSMFKSLVSFRGFNQTIVNDFSFVRIALLLCGTIEVRRSR